VGRVAQEGDLASGVRTPVLHDQMQADLKQGAPAGRARSH
jgi:hypothetical protein